MKNIKELRHEVESLIKKLDKDHPDQIPKFLYWLLTDLKYGAINQTKNENTIKSIRGVIDLFEEWFNTGLKPDRNLWNDLKWINVNNDDANVDFYANYVIKYVISHVTSYNTYFYNSAQASMYAAWAVCENSIPREESVQVQIDKLNQLIKDAGLYTFADYEKDAKSFD